MQELLVSDKWIREHEHNLDGFVPRIEISGPGSKHTFTIKSNRPYGSKEAMNEAVKVIRLNKGRSNNGR